MRKTKLDHRCWRLIWHPFPLFAKCNDYYINPDLWLFNTDFTKAARSLTAAYLNAAWGMNYAYTMAELQEMWDQTVISGDYLGLHNQLDAAKNAYADTDGDGIPEHQCPISASGY